ncbi:MAG: ATP phosphoribosyltransferase regulatory subunit, partial [Verrucomicrobiota bacterium]
VVKALTDNGLADAESLYAESLSLVACQSLPEVEAFFQERAGSDAVILERVSQRLKQWHELLAALRAMGLEDFIRVDMGIVRGLAYYTGFVFEAFQTVGKGRALAGGGRYDHLVEKLGYASMPAVGFGMGDVTLRLLLEELKLLPEKAAKLDAYVIIGGPAERETALRDIARLRQQGVKIDYPFKQQGFGKQFKTADQSNAEFALIYGAEELASGIVKVKKLDQGSETIVKREDLHKLFNVS